MTTHIKLHGAKADRFEAVKLELSDSMGYELSNPEVLGLLIAGVDSDDDSSSGQRPDSIRADTMISRTPAERVGACPESLTEGHSCGFFGRLFEVISCCDRHLVLRFGSVAVTILKRIRARCFFVPCHRTRVVDDLGVTNTM